MESVIKWTGSKRSQAKKIISLFPKEVNTYYEPFLGGGSIFLELLSNEEYKINQYICSDINEDLINLWKAIQSNPSSIINHYELLWNELKNRNDELKKEFYYEVRQRFNKDKNVGDFLFLNRTALNGLIRYNKKGEFNTSFHFGRDGIKPETLKNIIMKAHNLIKENNVTFIHNSYLHIDNTNETDIIYLDPPYFNTVGIYFGKIDFDEFKLWLNKQNASYFFSFDGKQGEKDNTIKMDDLNYKEHIYINSGNSSFSRVLRNKNDVEVLESLYIKKNNHSSK